MIGIFRKPKSILLLITLYSFQSYSQGLSPEGYIVERFEEKSPYDDELTYIFPILKQGNSQITEKINTYLIQDQLQIEFGKQKTSIFENIWPLPDKIRTTITSLEYTLETLNNKIYAVTLTGEFCSAYCEGYDRRYNFDLQNGNLISWDTLFTSSGKILLDQELDSFQKEKIDSILKQAHQQLNSDTLNDLDQEYYIDQIEMYEACALREFYFESVRFLIMPASIKFFLPRCSIHYNQNLDELWYLEFEIKISDWENKLSNYGRKILIN